MTTTDRQARKPTLTTRLVAACRDPRHHCALVLAANAGLVACAAAGPLTASLALHVMLLPINAWRLVSALRCAGSARPLATATLRADVAAARQKAGSMRCPAFDATVNLQTVRLSSRVAR